ncbi:MAG: FtsX-like permease family protein [Oscillospiraceae bacterium]|nr:FtsX-like permease family protein [Oscillospiraceae bacterium]
MLYKNTLIKIKKSFGRYLSIFIIVMVGVGFYAGIQSTAPDITKVADSYYRSQNLMDYKIVSSLGLTDKDVAALKALNGVKDVIPSYSLDVLSGKKALRIHSIEEGVNTIALTAGRMPQTDKECVADGRTYQLGDKISITSDVGNKLENKEFIVVGLTESALYIAKDYGSTTTGDGKLSSYIFVNKNNFTLDAYTEIYITALGSDGVAAYSDSYNKIVSPLNDELVSIKSGREISRYKDIYQEASDKISENETKLNDEKKKAELELSNAKAELDENVLKLKDAKAELLANETRLQENIKTQNAEFESAKARIADGWAQIDAAMNTAGMTRGEVGSKAEALDAAIQGMQTQLAALPENDSQRAQLSSSISEYSAKLENLKQLKASIDTLTAQEKQLDDGISTFKSEVAKAQAQLANGKTTLASNEQKLNNGYDEYNESIEKFNSDMAEAEAKLADGKADLANLEQPKWYISDRDAAVGYSQLDGGIQVVSSVAAIFPFLFILIVVLITSNSMARMIAEERGELGTLTSLGYRDKQIIFTYLMYVLSASGLGATAGFFVGCRVIPPLIYSNFQYILPPLVIRYNWIAFAIILVVTLALMTLVTVVGCNRELRENPASLMRPLPPKHGQKILLERIGFIWKRFSFTWKITMRNMFRYKKRALMTIVGVSCCTSFLVIGFGLRDSMDGVAQKQYGDIFRYGSIAILKEETNSISGDLKTLLDKEQLSNSLLIRQSALKCQSGTQSLDAYLVVPQDETLFRAYYHLARNDTKATLDLGIGGVIITQKIAKEFNTAAGGTITITDIDNNLYALTVAGVAENYTSNYIYMLPSLYQQTFGTPATFNAFVSGSSSDETALAEHLMDSGLVVNVIFASDMIRQAVDSNNSLNSIIVLLVVVASMLAVIVLYNLTAINISERIREIATLKVLGFRDRETNAYIYREALVLTIISIGIGMILGVFLHRFVLNVIESDYMALFRRIKWYSFVISGLLTLIFSAIMQVVTYFKLKKVDMIESLKSVE